jgi:hypothetical protein
MKQVTDSAKEFAKRLKRLIEPKKMYFAKYDGSWKLIVVSSHVNSFIYRIIDKVNGRVESFVPSSDIVLRKDELSYCEERIDV